MPATWRVAVEPREWQLEALCQWNGSKRGVAAVVTGGGKTIFAYLCMLAALDENPALQFIVIVPTVALLDQWQVGLLDDLGVPGTDIVVFGGGNRPRGIGRINLMVLNTARTVAPRVATAASATMLIVDECHRVASPMNARALQGHHAATLGLSATPERDFDDLFTDVVVPALGPVIYTYDYNRARVDGVISPFDLVNVSVSLTESEQRKYNQYTRQLVPLFRQHDRGEDVEARLHRLLRERARISTGASRRLPAAVSLVERHVRERVIVFHEQIQAANMIAAVLQERGHRAAAYHSELGSAIRQDNLRLFRRGELDVLVTCRALDEGINVPNASVAVIAASTSSTRQRIQRLGRVLRPAPGKSQATIYTLYATEPEAERLRAEAEHLQGADAVRWMEVKSL